MKALFISNDPNIFNATSAVRARMRSYAAHMEELHIVSCADAHVKEIQEEHLFLHPVHTSKLFRVRALTRAARTIITKYGIEVVSAQDPFEHGLAALRATHGTKTKLHIQVHTDFLSPWFIKSGTWRTMRSRFLNRYRRRIADQVLPQAAGIRAVSKRIKTSLDAHYGSRIAYVSVVPIATETVLPPQAKLPAHTFHFVLMAIGRLEPEKRVEDVLTALKLVVRRYSMVGLFIVGNGRERPHLEHLTQSLNLDKHVVFLGERTDAWGLLQNAQAFVQASAYEGYGRTFIEAALVRVPIVTTDVGIIGEVFRNNEDALVSPVTNPEAMAVNIMRLIEDTRMRQELSMHAEATARAHLISIGDLPNRIRDDLARTLPRL